MLNNFSTIDNCEIATCRRNTSDMLVNLPTTVGSKSTNTARGTCFPAPVSLKKVLKESSPPPMVLSLGIWPSGWIPCSKQYNSQHALPIWTPAWPTWTEIHSRYVRYKKHRGELNVKCRKLNSKTVNEVKGGTRRTDWFKESNRNFEKEPDKLLWNPM